MPAVRAEQKEKEREAAKITRSPLSLSVNAERRAEDFHPLEQQRKVGAIVCMVWLGKLNDLSINNNGGMKSWFVHQRNSASNDRRACQV